MAIVPAWIDPQDHDRTPAPSKNQSHSAYVGQGSHQLSPGSQQRLAKLPVNVMFNIADTFDNYVDIITPKSPTYHHIENVIFTTLDLISQPTISQLKYILPGAAITYYYGTISVFLQILLSR